MEDWIIGVIIVYILIALFVGVLFGDIAESKGHKRNTWTVLCVIFGLPAWLLVVALPNDKQHNELLAALQQNKNQNTIINNDLPEL